MEHEVAPEVAVVVEATPHEGLQPLVLLAEDEELTVKPVGPEKMARLGMQLHETDHLSKRGDYGRNYTRCFTLYHDLDHFLFAALFRHCPSSRSHVCFRFIMIASGYCPAQIILLWIHPVAVLVYCA